MLIPDCTPTIGPSRMKRHPAWSAPAPLSAQGALMAPGVPRKANVSSGGGRRTLAWRVPAVTVTNNGPGEGWWAR